MANEENLIPYKKGEISTEQAKRNGSIGGKKSAEVRKRKKLAKAIALEVLNSDVKLNPMQAGDQHILRILKERYGIEDVSEYDLNEISMRMIGAKAYAGNERSYKFLLEQAGQEAYVAIELKKLEIEREKIKFEREKWLAEQNQRENLISDLPQIIDDIGGLNDADGDE